MTKIDCNKINPLFLDFLDKNLDNNKTKLVQNHIDSCNKCQEELEQLSILFEEIKNHTNHDPSENLRQNFMQMIENEKQHKNADSNSRKATISLSSPFIRIAASILLLVGGILIGLTINSKNNKTEELSSLQKEVNEVKQLLIFSKLDQQSASQRIQAVNYAKEITTPDYSIINALINTMNKDNNTNVRMAAIQALSKYTNEKIVVDALVSSLEIQSDPLLQITLINILVDLKEQNAIESIKKILNQEETHETVKKLAEKGLTII